MPIPQTFNFQDALIRTCLPLKKNISTDIFEKKKEAYSEMFFGQ